jgi:Fur family transcriptional regulator, peroxide stress response regulator
MSFRPEILAAFRARHVRCTPQRYAILDHLMRSAKHPTAEEVYKAINRADPRASLATVYKSLHAMTEAGLIRELTVEGHVVRFESNTEKHHHFVCDRCGRVEDIEWFDVPLPAQRNRSSGRTVHSYEVVMRGLCRHCSF